MKQIILISLISMFSLGTTAQSRVGITGIRDSSYNIETAYNKHLKNYPDLRKVEEIPEKVTTENNITYCTVGTRALALDIFSPLKASAGKKRAIIIVHGGGWRSGNRSMHYPLAQRLASMGYVCFTPEYRLSTEALYPAAVHDLKAVVRWVRKNATDYDIDPDQIVAAGHSAGGELAAFLGATNNDAFFEGDDCNKGISSKVNAVINMDGILAFIHPESGEGDDSKGTSAATFWFGYSKTENPDLWKQAAPLTHVGAGDPPILFVSSSVDRMHAGREDFIAVLNKNSIYSEVVTFKGSPHVFVLFNPWFDSTVIIMDAFIRKVFKERSTTRATTLRHVPVEAAPLSRYGCQEGDRPIDEEGFTKNLFYYGRTRQFHSIFPG